MVQPTRALHQENHRAEQNMTRLDHPVVALLPPPWQSQARRLQLIREQNTALHRVDTICEHHEPLVFGGVGGGFLVFPNPTFNADEASFVTPADEAAARFDAAVAVALLPSDLSPVLSGPP